MKKCQPVTLTPYLDGELNDDMRREIDKHLQSCAACGALLEQLTDASRQVRSMGRAVIPMAALTPALEIFNERAGLTPIPVTGHAPEVPWAAPAVETLAQAMPEKAPERDTAPPSDLHDDGLPDAWSPDSAANAARRAIGIPDDEFWGQQNIHRDSTPADPEAERAAATEGPQPPTWIEPEPWVPAPPAEQAHAPAAAQAESPEAVEPELDLPPVELKPEPEPQTETEPEVSTEHVEALDEHPSPPPPEIRPPWMDAPTSEDDDLEEAGRRAVDEAIGPDQTEALTPAEIARLSAAADARADQGSEAQEPPRGWLASVFDRRQEAKAAGPSAEQPDAEAGMAATPEPLEGAPDERDVAAFRARMAEIAPPTFDVAPLKELQELHPDPVADQAEATAPDERQPAEATSEAGDDPGQVRGYREALVGARGEAPPPARGLSSLNTQLKIGLLAVLAIVIVLATVLLVSQRPQTSSTTSKSSQPGVATHPTTAATPSRSATPSPVPSATSTGPAAPPLTELVNAGAGGGGWRVTGIRSGSPNPATGITRVVFDLQGAGPQPDAQMGRGSDGAVYLTAPGITISPAALSGFDGRGVVTGITQTGTQGLALRLATNGRPGFSIGYLSVPSRLVLDFK